MTRRNVATALVLAVMWSGAAGRAAAQGAAAEATPATPGGSPRRDGPAARELPPFPPLRWDDALAAVLARFPGVDRDGVAEFLGQEFPGELERFKELARGEVGEAMEYVHAVIRDALEMLEARRRNPELFEVLRKKRRLERQAAELAEAVRGSEGEERKSRTAELRAVVAAAFDVKQGLMRRDLEAMEREFHELQKMVERREQSREAIIERRVGQLTGDGALPEW